MLAIIKTPQDSCYYVDYNGEHISKHWTLEDAQSFYDAMRRVGY